MTGGGLAEHLRLLVSRGQVQRALALATQHLSRAPGDVAVRLALVDLLEERGERAQALQHAMVATTTAPASDAGPRALAALLERAGRPAAALQAWDLAAQRAAPGDAEALRRGGDLAWRRGDLPEALRRLRAATAREPGPAEGWALLAAAEASVEQLDAAQAAADAAHARAPHNRTVSRLAADLAARRGDAEGARARYAPLRADPRAAWAHAVALPPILRDADHEEATRTQWRADLAALSEAAEAGLAGQPDAWLQAARGVFPLHYTGGDLLDEQRQLGGLLHRVVTAAVPEAASAPAVPERDRRRIAVVTATFRKHTVTKLFSRWMRDLDRRRFEVHAIDVGLLRDETSGTLEGWCDAVHRVPSSARDALRVLRELAADAVLFPEVGMDDRVLQIAAARSAPLQLVAWGHPVTTGLPTVDVFLSSAAMAVQPDRTWTTEARVDLPGIGIVVEPAARPPGAHRDHFGLPAGRPLLLCVQSLFKYRPWTDALLVEIAARAPQALLVFVQDQRPLVTQAWRRRLEGAFAAAGLAFDHHVRVLPRLTEADYLRLLCVGDLFVDSPGWSGGNTTLEALAMGLPTLAFPGRTMRGRHCRGMVLEMGVPALAPDSADQWLGRAVELAHTRSARDDLAETVRARAGALFGDPRSTRALEALLEAGAPQAR